MRRAPVEERGQVPHDGAVLVEQSGDVPDRVEQLPDDAVTEHLAGHQDDEAAGRGERREGEHSQARRAVEHDDVVVPKHRGQRLAQDELPAGTGQQLRLGSSVLRAVLDPSGVGVVHEAGVPGPGDGGGLRCQRLGCCPVLVVEVEDHFDNGDIRLLALPPLYLGVPRPRVVSQCPELRAGRGRVDLLQSPQQGCLARSVHPDQHRLARLDLEGAAVVD